MNALAFLLFSHVFYSYFAASQSAPAEITSTPASVRLSSRVTIQCKALFGGLQLVSSGALLNGFELVPEGCGAQVPSCYRFNGTADVAGGRNATATWWLPGANASADGVALWCRAVHNYSAGEAALCQREHSACSLYICLAVRLSVVRVSCGVSGITTYQ